MADLCAWTVLSVAALWTLLIGTGEAWGAEVRVAIVTETVDVPMVARLRAELEALGVTARVLERTPPEDLLPILAEVDGVGAFALRSDQLEMVVAGRGGASVRREVPRPQGDPIEESRMGVRAIEMLRAGLLEVHAADLGPRVDGGSLSLLELAGLAGSSAPANEKLTTLQVGSELAAGDLQAAPVVNLILGVSYGIAARVDVCAGGAVPLIRTRYADAAGEAVFGISVLQLGAAYHLVDTERSWVPTLGAGLGLRVLRISGEAVPPYADETIRSVGLAPYGSWGLSYWPGGPLRVRGDLHLSVARKAAVFFVDREVGAWGPLQTGFVVSLEVDLR